MQYINIGKLVNTHGIKGEVRVISDFPHKKLVFKENFKIYIGKEKKEFIIEKYRHHKIFDMLLFKGYYDINLVEYLKGSYVYINKDDLLLDDKKVLSIDLLGFNVIIDNKKVGIIKEIINSPANEILRLDSNILIPYVDEFILNIDTSKKEVIVKNMKGLL